MPQGTSTVNKVLSMTATGRVRGRFAADIVAPIVPTEHETAVLTFLDRNAAGSKDYGDLRGRGAAAQTIDTEVSYPVQFKNHHHALATTVPDEDMASDAAALRIKGTYLEAHVITPLMIAKERKLVALLAAILTSGRTSSPSTQWNASGAQPITDIKNKIATTKTASGIRPNLFVCDENVLIRILDSAEAQDKLKHDGSGIDGSIPTLERQLALMLGIDRVFSTSCTYNTAARKATPSFSDLWGETALLTYVEPPSTISSNAFMQTVWTAPDFASGSAGGSVNGWRVQEMYKPENHGWWMEGGQYYDIKCAYADDASADSLEVAQCPAHLFTNVLA